MSADRDEYIGTLMGLPPDDWNEKIQKALELCVVADKEMRTGPADEDVFLIAAAAHRQRTNVNVAGLVQRAKQVAQWLSKRPFVPAERGTRALLENKSEELSRQVANGLFVDEGFVLLIFQTGMGDDNGWLAHAASIGRNDQIAMLERFLAHLKTLQADQS